MTHGRVASLFVCLLLLVHVVIVVVVVKQILHILVVRARNVFRRNPSCRFSRVCSGGERGALDSRDPVRVRVGELERHDTGVPAALHRLLDARAERRGVDEAAVGDVGRGSGLADDELVDVDAVLLDLEDGGSTSAVEERVAILVAGAGRLCGGGQTRPRPIVLRDSRL